MSRAVPEGRQKSHAFTDRHALVRDRARDACFDQRQNAVFEHDAARLTGGRIEERAFALAEHVSRVRKRRSAIVLPMRIPANVIDMQMRKEHEINRRVSEQYPQIHFGHSTMKSSLLLLCEATLSGPLARPDDERVI